MKIGNVDLGEREAEFFRHLFDVPRREGCDVIDINFGCPVSKIAGRGTGSGMMRESDK